MTILTPGQPVLTLTLSKGWWGGGGRREEQLPDLPLSRPIALSQDLPKGCRSTAKLMTQKTDDNVL